MFLLSKILENVLKMGKYPKKEKLHTINHPEKTLEF